MIRSSLGLALLWSCVSCASATTITLELRADTDTCPKINESGVVGTPRKNVDNATDYPLQNFQKGCVDNRLGTLVLSPQDDSSAERNARVGIRVVAGLNGKTASACDDPKGVAQPDCIIAKREVSFVEGSNVPLTVTLSGSCVHVSCDQGFECDPDQTDPDKKCVPLGMLSP